MGRNRVPHVLLGRPDDLRRYHALSKADLFDAFYAAFQCKYGLDQPAENALSHAHLLRHLRVDLERWSDVKDCVPPV